MPVSTSTEEIKWKAPYKWAGGKSRQIGVIEDLMPNTMLPNQQYIEPFLGGGTVLINQLLAYQGMGVQFVVADANDAIINFWLALLQQPDTLIETLHQPQFQKYNSLNDIVRKKSFEKIKKLFNTLQMQREEREPLGKIDRHRSIDPLFAACFFYLAKACYNGIWRINAYGMLTSYAGARFATLVDERYFFALSQLMAREKIDFYLRDCFETLQMANAGDVCYADPPYDDTDILYTKGTNDVNAVSFQIKLKDTFDQLARRGVRVFISNGDTVLIRQLFKEWEKVVLVITSRLGKLSDKNELFIFNRVKLNPTLSERRSLRAIRNRPDRYEPY